MPAWTDTTDRQLLLAIIHLTASSLPNWKTVADLMGEGYTAESTRQHFQKLRKASKAQFGEPGTPSASAKKATPRKRAADDGDETPSKRKAKKGVQVECDDEEALPTPVKKAETEVKDEIEDGDDEWT